MSDKSYLPRLCDKEIQLALESSGAVLIEGAKWCGKTSLASIVSQSVLYMQDPDNTSSYQAMADTKPSLLLKGKTPKLIDEWQMAPVLWDAVRFEVDKRGETGQFILTGSAVPSDNVKAHTGTGRISRILMRPMSLYESLESNGSVSLNALFSGIQEEGAKSDLSVEKIAFALCRGGWPASVTKKDKAALRMARDYVEAVINYDVSRVDGIEKNPERVRLLLRSLARNVATQASLQTLKDDIEATDITISDKTIAGYLNALRRIFVVEDLPAWLPSLRSKTAIRSSAKRHFVDPSIATAVMRINPEGVLSDFQTFGFLLEALCTRDVRIYAQTIDGDVFHYRDKSGLEADLIVRLRDGRWAAIEVKLGSKQIDEAANNLLLLKTKINADKMGEPSFLMVLTGGQFAYRRNDGVWVVPIGCLKD
ncbi:MAG: AAA family ATPase [Bacteroidetes bacterium CG18_big_fil_WC_8_21_14_2_50_41_14]|nr:MAG: AAA family ATPase [Bacteroidetes bacterium CG18_big_fil_WC_8_21_14_2_50_41_14]PJB54890.1 MAG: AAA family ATPase [Bacteroidetes bacterium CG_4_9_14_3_um_filter_41_19]